MAKFQYVTLFVSKGVFAKTVDWYLSKLGLQKFWESPDFVLLGGETGARVGLHVGEPAATPERVQLHFQVEDVDAVYQRLRAGGLNFNGPPHETGWGYRVAVTSDPAEHTVEIYSVSSHDEDND